MGFFMLDNYMFSIDIADLNWLAFYSREEVYSRARRGSKCLLIYAGVCSNCAVVIQEVNIKLLTNFPFSLL